MKVALLMPVFNCEDTINQTLDTILNQTYSKFKLYIINNNCSQKTLEIIKSKKDSRIQIFKFTKKQQCGASLNYGLTKIKEDVIVRVDGDDLYNKNFIAELLKVYSNGKNKIVYSSYIFNYLDENRKEVIRAFTDKKLLLWRMLFFCTIDHNVLYERKFINALNNYTEIDYGEDYDLWTRSILKDDNCIGAVNPDFIGCECIKSPSCMTYRLKSMKTPIDISYNFIKKFLNFNISKTLIEKIRSQPPENRSSYYSNKDKLVLNTLLSIYINKMNISQEMFLLNKKFFQFYV